MRREEFHWFNQNQGKIMPVGKAYKKIIQQWKDVLAEESFGLHFT